MPPLPSLTDLALFALIIIVLLSFVGGWKEPNTIDWVTLKTEVLPGGKNAIKKIVITQNQTALIYLTNDKILTLEVGDIEVFQEKLAAVQDELGIEIWDRIEIMHKRNPYLSAFIADIPSFLFLALFASFLVSFQRTPMPGMGGLFGSITNSRAKLYGPEGSPINFSNVAGLDEAKVEIQEFVQFLKNPGKFTNLGAKIPKGALLVGPPGTGKTLLAKATAGEAGVPFFSISGSEFQEMFVGVGPARVRDLFAKARKKAPSIIFIDEIDAIGRKRSQHFQSHDERENTLNQLLVEMDGFNTQEGVVVFAATNRADVLDKALTRPGRFDRTINIDLPDLKGRKDILLVHLKGIKLEETDMAKVAEIVATLTPGMSGADLQNVVNEAALIAARNNKESVQMVDFESAIERVIGGLEKKSKVLSPSEKRTVAYHEAGHAVAGWFLEHAHPLLKVSIIPRGSAALGYAQFQPRDQYLFTKEQLFHDMCAALGGRIAEELIFKSISTGAANDLERVTRMASAQITELGMSDLIGNLSFRPPPGQEKMVEKPYSDLLQRRMDEEIRKLIKEAEVYTRNLLTEHKDGLIKVAERLIQCEKISKDDLIELLGPRPWKELRTFGDLIAGEPARDATVLKAEAE
jgi:AFG3 family protein